MGASCCAGQAPSRRRRGRSARIERSSTREPLLRDSEREAVSNLLKYLEQGGLGAGELSSQILNEVFSCR